MRVHCQSRGNKMAGPGKTSLSASGLELKLRDLNASMQSIQSVSKWLIHNRKYAKTTVGVWFREMQKGTLYTC